MELLNYLPPSIKELRYECGGETYPGTHRIHSFRVARIEHTGRYGLFDFIPLRAPARLTLNPGPFFPPNLSRLELLGYFSVSIDNIPTSITRLSLGD